MVIERTPASTTAIKPWYREPWPVAILGVLIVTVVACGVTLWYAVSSNDGLVSDDYYKEGLGINRALAREEFAAHLGLVAEIRIDQTNRIQVMLAAKEGIALPDRLRLTLGHPTRAGLDQNIVLARDQNTYSGNLQNIIWGRWNLVLEDENRSWRMTGAAQLPTESVLRIAPAIRVGQK